MLRPFFYNARTWGPTLARDIIFLVKPDHQVFTDENLQLSYNMAWENDI